MAGSKHHPYDRAMRDLWRHATTDVAEVLLGRSLPPGTVAEQTHLDRELIVDALATNPSGSKLHVEFQTRADPRIGLRMARYYTALIDHPKDPAPDQFVLLLHRDAGKVATGIFTHGDGNISLRYQVVRLWQIDPEQLLSRPWLARLATLGDAPDAQRPKLLERAMRTIQSQLPADAAEQSLAWTVELSYLYLQPDIVRDVVERTHMPIDLSHTPALIQAREEALHEGLEEGREQGLEQGLERQREAIRRVLDRRFGDPAVTARVTEIPDALLTDATVRAATGTADEFTTWLDKTHR